MENYSYKFTIFGEVGVGKSSIIERFETNTFKKDGHEPTQIFLLKK